MEKTKKKRHWFLKFPIIPAIVVPLISVIAASFLSGMLTTGIITGAPDLAPMGSEINSIASAAVRIFIAFLVIIVMKISSKRTFQFGFHKDNLKTSFLLSLFCLLMIADNIVEGLVFGEGMPVTFLGILAAVIKGIAPGFFEEVVCRGLGLSNMMDKWQKKKNYILKSVLISGIIFGLIHLVNLGSDVIRATLIQVFYAAGLGIYFGAVYVRTRNLWGTVIMHALIDVASFLFIWPDGFYLQDLISGIVITVVFTAIGLYLIRPKKHAEIAKLWEKEAVLDEQA